MAEITAFDEFDIDTFNLFAMRYLSNSVVFANDRAVPGLGRYDIWGAEFDYEFVFIGGKSLKYSVGSKLPTGGSATVFGGIDYDSNVTWGIEGINISGKSIGSAMRTVSTNDDLILLKSALSKADTFTLSDYDDRARGYGGNDKMYGGYGDDSLYGGTGNDVIKGEDGGDYLTGGEGSDKLYGGSNDSYSDTFVFNEVADSKVATSGRDFIYQFENSIDNIKLTEIDANTKSSGNQKFFFSESGAAKNSVWVSQSGPDVNVYGDVNGDAKADFAIKVMGVDGLFASDFLL